jgi:N-acetylglucosaminyldiphosphoundecaprenol N-acetyl-beta-D-mannosaminyltransferase
MALLAAMCAAVAIVWGAILAQRVALLVGVAVFLVVGYVFGFDFWNAHVGPLPITLDRIVLVGLLAALAIQWRQGRLTLRRPTIPDYLLFALVGLLAASALVARPLEVAAGNGSAWGRLVTAFAVPALLYTIVRQAPVSHRQWLALLACFVGLGVYLAVTALAEISGRWSLVFPRYIADPNLGIHFGRARGPGLNAASLGMFLTASACCAWLLLREVSRRGQQLAILLFLPMAALAIFVTYTRSTWLGFVAAGLVIAAFEIPRRRRLPAFAAAAMVGILAVGISWNQIVGLQREGPPAESEHSVDQRESFAYVSWQMFKDHPLFGVGFGRFYDKKLPYLSDRSQPFELESIRPLHHHNTFLGLLTETGIVGLLAFVALLASWAIYGWRLATRLGENSSSSVRLQGVLMLALLANYVCSAMFHDLTLVPAQHWLLFVFAAITVNLQRHIARPSWSGLPAGRSYRHELPAAPAWSGHGNTIHMLGMNISRVTMHEAVAQVLTWCREPRGAACRFVVTPNIDHAVMIQQRGDFGAAYAAASLVLADGAPIVLASLLLSKFKSGAALPERVAGSDLVPQLFAAANAAAPLRVFLLGAAPGVANAAAGRIKKLWPGAQIVGTYSPPPGFENNAAESNRIAKVVAAAAPDLLIVGLGAPKQELWVHRYRHELEAKVAICAGATIDFLAGEKKRSPRWMRRTGLEWLYRVLSEPRRLAGRYAKDAWEFPRLVWRELVQG